MAANDITVLQEQSDGSLKETLLTPSVIGAAPTSHTHAASQISDSTAAGRTLLKASTVQEQRTALDIFVNVANASTLPASGNFQRVYLTSDTGKAYVWNGSGYTEVSPSPPEQVELIAACSDEISPLTTGNRLTFRSPYLWLPNNFMASANTPPTGSSIIVEFRVDGAVMATATIPAAGVNSVLTSASFDEIDLNDEISIHVAQVGTTSAGTGLKVYLFGTRV